MKYELRTVESLIETHLQPTQVKDGQFAALDLPNFRIEIETEIERIRKAFIESVFNFKKDNQVERYIQQHQSSLIRLCNSMIKHVSPDVFKESYQYSKITNISEVFFFVYSELEKLLTFIENYFSKYFNQNERVPTHYRIIGQMEFREKIKSISQSKDCGLIAVALYPINEFISQNNPITFRKLIYLKTLFNEVKSVCATCKGNKAECKLHCSLIYLNFNSFKFFNYLTSTIKDECQNQKPITKKIETLSYHLKRLNQAQIKPNTAYKINHPSIKGHITDWILEEMSHLEKIYQLSLKFPDKPIEELSYAFKLTTDFSVSQIAYFIRLLVDTGILQNKNQKELLTFFANHLSTKKTENISPESFRTKFYATDESSREVVKEMVIKLLNETQKEV